MSETARRWGIVGGGILGMRLAGKLAEGGDHVVLIESAPALGGLAGAWTIGGVTWDRHYHVILRSDQHVLDLLQELGLRHEIRWARARTGFCAGGRLHSLSSSLDFLRSPFWARSKSCAWQPRSCALRASVTGELWNAYRRVPG